MGNGILLIIGKGSNPLNGTSIYGESFHRVSYATITSAAIRQILYRNSEEEEEKEDPIGVSGHRAMGDRQGKGEAGRPFFVLDESSTSLELSCQSSNYLGNRDRIIGELLDFVCVPRKSHSTQIDVNL